MGLVLPKRSAPLLLTLLLCPAPPVSAITPKESALHAIGLRTIKAIAGGDASYLASIADPQGITAGKDGVQQPIEAFRAELEHRSGAYCDLFEKNCATDHNPVYTLQHAFTSGPDPLDADLAFNVDRAQGTLEYRTSGGGNLIATFVYRYTGAKWVLSGIRYP